MLIAVGYQSVKDRGPPDIALRKLIQRGASLIDRPEDLQARVRLLAGVLLGGDTPKNGSCDKVLPPDFAG